jgi:pyridinium-3,5-biscarboxylic acid mononucleotide sulfurtransferase
LNEKPTSQLTGTPTDTGVEQNPQEKLQRLKAVLHDMGSVLVAYSGGVDSTFVASVAREVLGDQAVAVTGISPSISQTERDEARDLAERIGIRHVTIDTQEMDDPGYVANSPLRCYHCKTELYGKLQPLAEKLGLNAVADGSNMDDTGDFRPGRKAASEHSVRSPLIEAGLTKQEIRLLSKERDLPTWDKPAMACLSSRIPYGTPVTVLALDQISAAELFIRGLGVRELRVRHHGDIARIETDQQGMDILTEPANRDAVVARLKELGYLFVALDLSGYKSGSMNAAVKRSVTVGAS